MTVQPALAVEHHEASAEAIRGRLAAASHGTWQIHELHAPHRLGVRSAAGTIWVPCGAPADVAQDNADADLLAHAPDDLGALLREVESLRGASQVFLESMRRAEKVLWSSDAVLHPATRSTYDMVRRSLMVYKRCIEQKGGVA